MSEDSNGSSPIVVYGTRWCAATQMVRRFLDRNRVPFEFRDMDADEAAANQVKWWTGGNASHPTVQIGGQVLVEPSITELEEVLGQNGIL
jgi:mycoredoxin